MSQLKVNSIIPLAGIPSGSNGGIIQVKEHYKSDVASTTSTSYTDMTGMSATITPTSSSNKILVTVVLSQLTSTDTVTVSLTTGNNTVILQGDTVSGKVMSTAGLYVGSASYGRGRYGSPQTVFSKLHSPNTTSAVTYKLRWFVYSGTGYINRTVYDADRFAFRNASTITLMEVSG